MPLRSPFVIRSLAFAALLALLPLPGRAEEPASAALQPRHQAFLDLNEPLLTDQERAVFDALGRDFQRDLFIDAFWKARDPFPETAANELRNGWEDRLEEVRQRFDDLRDDRARMFVW